MAYNRLVGLEKGKRAFLGCFLMSAAGGFGCVHIHTHARVRASAWLLFRKQNKVLLYYDKALNYSLLFRKQNKYFNTLKCKSVRRLFSTIKQ